MKRFHVHVAVANLDDSIRFYSKLFGSAPSVSKSDYAKWMLDDPRVNFAISQRGRATGINHLGLQVDSAEELEAVNRQCAAADIATAAEAGASCCYARSNKYWITDPQGIAWEAFHTLGEIPIYGGHGEEAASGDSACCAPAITSAPERTVSICCGPSTGAAMKNTSSASTCCG